jgi:hypothetical protein
MSTEEEILAYKRKKQTEKMMRCRELARQQKQAEAAIAAREIAKESKYVQEMRKQIAEEIRRMKEGT